MLPTEIVPVGDPETVIILLLVSDGSHQVQLTMQPHLRTAELRPGDAVTVRLRSRPGVEPGTIHEAPDQHRQAILQNNYTAHTRKVCPDGDFVLCRRVLMALEVAEIATIARPDPASGHVPQARFPQAGAGTLSAPGRGPRPAAVSDPIPLQQSSGSGPRLTRGSVRSTGSQRVPANRGFERAVPLATPMSLIDPGESLEKRWPLAADLCLSNQHLICSHKHTCN